MRHCAQPHPTPIVSSPCSRHDKIQFTIPFSSIKNPSVLTSRLILPCVAVAASAANNSPLYHGPLRARIPIYTTSSSDSRCTISPRHSLHSPSSPLLIVLRPATRPVHQVRARHRHLHPQPPRTANWRHHNISTQSLRTAVQPPRRNSQMLQTRPQIPDTAMPPPHHRAA